MLIEMPKEVKVKTMRMTEPTHARITRYCQKDEKYEDALNRLLDFNHLVKRELICFRKGDEPFDDTLTRLIAIAEKVANDPKYKEL